MGDGDSVRFCRDSAAEAASGPCTGESIFVRMTSTGNEWCCNRAKSLNETDGASAIFD